MKYKYIVFLLTFIIKTLAQPPSGSCNQSTTTVNTIFYPNTTSNITSTVTNVRGMYLCGPNTLVYDTSNIVADPNACRAVFIAPNSTLVTNSPACTFVEHYFVKNNGTIIITANTNTSGVSIIYEMGAIIIDNSSGVMTYSCSSISLPTVNCTSSGLNELRGSTSSMEEMRINPNPACEFFDIEFLYGSSSSRLLIFNAFGQVVKEIELLYRKSTTVNINEMQNGIYFIGVFNENRNYSIKKLVIAK